MKLLLTCALLAFAAIAALASPVTYNVWVNTSSLAGTTGSVDFNLNPGPLISQSAFVQVTSFLGSGTLAGTPSLSGDASGSLPSTLTLDNGSGFNDYFQSFIYGSSLSFALSLYGPALSSPNGTSSSGSTFAFSMFSDLAGTMPAFTTDVTDGFAYLVNVNLDGSTTVTNYILNSSSVPEPATWFSIGIALVIATVSSIRIRRSND